MKRTISHEASDAAARLRVLGFGTGIQNCGGIPDPLTLLGLGPHATWSEVRQAYVARLRVYHPEHHPQEFMRVVDAYDMLKRFFRTTPGASGATGSGDCENIDQAVKRRRADAAGTSLTSPGANAPNFAGLQECWRTACVSAPAIALDPSGVGHIGQRDRGMQGAGAPGFGNSNPGAIAAPSAFFNSFGGAVSSAAAPGHFGMPGKMMMDDDDDGCLARSVSNHMGNASGCAARFGGDSAMMIG